MYRQNYYCHFFTSEYYTSQVCICVIDCIICSHQMTSLFIFPLIHSRLNCRRHHFNSSQRILTFFSLLPQTVTTLRITATETSWRPTKQGAYSLFCFLTYLGRCPLIINTKLFSMNTQGRGNGVSSSLTVTNVSKKQDRHLKLWMYRMR